MQKSLLKWQVWCVHSLLPAVSIGVCLCVCEGDTEGGVVDEATIQTKRPMILSVGGCPDCRMELSLVFVPAPPSTRPLICVPSPRPIIRPLVFISPFMAKTRSVQSAPALIFFTSVLSTQSTESWQASSQVLPITYWAVITHTHRNTQHPYVWNHCKHVYFNHISFKRFKLI